MPRAFSKSLIFIGLSMAEESAGAGRARGLGREKAAATSDRALTERKKNWQCMVASLRSE